MPSPRPRQYSAAAGGSWQQIVASLAGRGAGCLDNIIERESGGNVSATNPDGAYGIPQALPGSKMASAGADWQTNPGTQIRWMIGYTNRHTARLAQPGSMSRPWEATSARPWATTASLIEADGPRPGAVQPCAGPRRRARAFGWGLCPG